MFDIIVQSGYMSSWLGCIVRKILTVAFHSWLHSLQLYSVLVDLEEMYSAFGDVLFHMVHASFIFPRFYLSSVKLNKHYLPFAFITGNESYWRC